MLHRLRAVVVRERQLIEREKKLHRVDGLQVHQLEVHAARLLLPLPQRLQNLQLDLAQLRLLLQSVLVVTHDLAWVEPCGFGNNSKRVPLLEFDSILLRVVAGVHQVLSYLHRYRHVLHSIRGCSTCRPSNHTHVVILGDLVRDQCVALLCPVHQIGRRRHRLSHAPTQILTSHTLTNQKIANPVAMCSASADSRYNTVASAEPCTACPRRMSPVLGSVCCG